MKDLKGLGISGFPPRSQRLCVRHSSEMYLAKARRRRVRAVIRLRVTLRVPPWLYFPMEFLASSAPLREEFSGNVSRKGAECVRLSGCA